MLKNYFKIAIRSLAKNKSYVIINTLGMGTAIACCITAYLSYEFNAEFDHDQPRLDEIYQVVSMRDMNNYEQPYAIAPIKFSEMANDQVTGVENVVRVIPEWGSVRDGDNVFWTNFFYVDPNFTEVFQIPLVKGDWSDLEQPQNIFITEEAAEKFFGDVDPMGKTVEHYVNDEPRPYIVAGVIGELPPNSSFKFMESVVHMDNYESWAEDYDEKSWDYWTAVFIQVKNPQDVPRVEAQLKDKIIPVQNKAREDFVLTRFDLEPLDGMADRGQNMEIWSYWFDRGVPQAAIIGPIIMAGLLMLLACFNYTNTSIAMSGRRLKEIGLRKVMGGLKKQLVAQFILENLVMCFVALVLGIVIAELILPYYNSMWEFLVLDISYIDNLDLILFLFGLLIAVGLVAGSYPSIFLSRFEATPILRGTVKFGGNTITSKVLLVLQLSISLMALVAAFAFLQNANFQREFDLGFNKDQLIYTFVDDGKEYELMRNELLQYEEIKTISGTDDHFLSSSSAIVLDMGEDDLRVETYYVGHDYFDVMEIELSEGREFREKSETDIAESVIANELFIKEQGIENPIGHRLVVNDTTQLFIVGVAENSYTRALWGPVEPILYRLAPEENFRRVLITADLEDMQTAHEHLGEAYNKIFPGRLYNGIYMDEELAEGEMINKNIVIIFSFLGFVALVLSISGLYAMISLSLLKRTKEIGVRKVLGASVNSIVSKMNSPFVIMVTIALVIGSVGAYFMVDALLGMIFTQYAAPGALSMLLGSALLFVIAVSTVTGRVLRAALVNPVNSLRSE